MLFLIGCCGIALLVFLGLYMLIESIYEGICEYIRLSKVGYKKIKLLFNAS